MTNPDNTAGLERIAEALFNSGACSVGYRGDMRMEQCRIHAAAVAEALSRPQSTPPADIAGVLAEIEEAVRVAELDEADDRRAGEESGERTDLWEPPEVTLFTPAVRALTQHVRAKTEEAENFKTACAMAEAEARRLEQHVRTHLSGGGVDYQQDPKFSFRNGYLLSRDSGPLPLDEPVFIFRARDRRAVKALSGYRDDCADPQHREAVSRRIEDFARFAEQHPDRMKEPDTALSASNREELFAENAKNSEPKASGVSEGVRAILIRARDSLKHALAPFKPHWSKADAERVLADLDALLSDQTPKVEESHAAALAPMPTTLPMPEYRYQQEDLTGGSAIAPNHPTKTEERG